MRDSTTGTRPRGEKRNSTACESCRAAKSKCKPSDQPGVCARCFAAKRECISRTIARPRRARQISRIVAVDSSSSSPEQATAFSIETFVPGRSHGDVDYESLRDIHTGAFDKIMSDSEDADFSTPAHTGSPSVASSLSRAATDIWRKPEFNTATAQSLLEMFQGMLKNIPFFDLSPDITIPQLAATRPFVLLAILTVTSGAGSVHKHSLYDDEFLKILGLKYVSGGDESLELLQGLLIYCSWYPFHLRPKNSQLGRFLRMASGIIHDLNIDDNFLTCDPWTERIRSDELDKIRVYVSYIYLVSTYIVVWKGDRYLSTKHPPWATTAIDILEQQAERDSDCRLAVIARLSALFCQAAEATINKPAQPQQNSQLALIGLSQQYNQLHSHLKTRYPNICDEAPVRMQLLFLDLYLDAGCLLSFPVTKLGISTRSPRSAPSVSHMISATKRVASFLDIAIALDDASMLAFTINDRTHLIIALTLAYRLSFPVSLCPGFDWESAREQIQLGRFLTHATTKRESDPRSTGILAANRVVLGVLHAKYNSKVDGMSNASVEGRSSRSSGCPVMGGAGELAVAQWDAALAEPPVLSDDATIPDILPLFHDIWANGGEWSEMDKMPWDAL